MWFSEFRNSMLWASSIICWFCQTSYHFWVSISQIRQIFHRFCLIWLIEIRNPQMAIRFGRTKWEYRLKIFKISKFLSSLTFQGGEILNDLNGGFTIKISFYSKLESGGVAFWTVLIYIFFISNFSRKNQQKWWEKCWKYFGLHPWSSWILSNFLIKDHTASKWEQH